MNISRSILIRRHRQRGSAVVVYLALLAIMVILAAANSNTLLHLHRELNLLEHRQIKRLNASAAHVTPTVESPATLGAP
jgi:type II secretory pathway component PulK